MKRIAKKGRCSAILLTALLLAVLLAGCCLLEEEGNLIVENESAVDVGAVEFSQAHSSQTVSCAAGPGLSLNGGRYAFWGDPDDGTWATVTVYAPDGERVLARGSWQLSFEDGLRYIIKLTGRTVHDLELELN